MLDSKDVVRSLDQKDMLGAIEDLPKNLSDGLRRGRMSGLPRFSPKEVVFCGVGGSAIGAEIMCEWLRDSLDIPCCVSRGYTLPAHVGKDSLVIVASYSGNTEETLSMFDDARKKRAKILSITSGGQLSKLSESMSVPFARIPAGLVPRASVGYMFGAMLGSLERSRIINADKQVEEAVRAMGKATAYCKQSVPTTNNPAKMLAHELLTHLPVIVGYGLSRPVAKRWADQLNENGKSMAFTLELPELNHNSIVGIMKDQRNKGLAFVFLDHGKSDARTKRRVVATKDMIGRVAPVYSTDALGTSPLAKMFSLMIVGDYTSAYLGILRNEDPSTNEPIDELKATLSKK